MTQRLLLVCWLACAAVSACSPKQDTTFSRGAPESLIDVSSEVVNLSVKSAREIDELSQWINRDQPTRAELYCAEGSSLCTQTRQVLELFGVPTMQVASNSGTITLIYERVLARDCQQRFVDNLTNYTNENHPAFGCSIAANMVQQISNKQQIVSPNVGDYRDAQSAINYYNRYQSPPPATPPDLSLRNSTLNQVGR